MGASQPSEVRIGLGLSSEGGRELGFEVLEVDFEVPVLFFELVYENADEGQSVTRLLFDLEKKLDEPALASSVLTTSLIDSSLPLASSASR